MTMKKHKCNVKTKLKDDAFDIVDKLNKKGYCMTEVYVILHLALSVWEDNMSKLRLNKNIEGVAVGVVKNNAIRQDNFEAG